MPLFLGGVVLGLLGSWITYQTALHQLRDEFVLRGKILTASVVHMVNVAGGPFQATVGDVRLAIEEFVKLEPNVLGAMAATKDPFVLLVSTIHSGIQSDEMLVETLADILVH